MNKSRLNTGFTLIELVITIVILTVAITGVMSVFYTNSIKGVKPILEIKAIELGQAMLDEIILKKWDEDSPIGGGTINTALANIGTETGETNREHFDDTDDYNGYSDGTPSEPLKNERGELLNGFEGFSRSVTIVFEKPAEAPAAIAAVNYKKITVQITIPTGDSFAFTTTKTNI